MYKEVGVKKRTLLFYLCVKLLKVSTFEYKRKEPSEDEGFRSSFLLLSYHLEVLIDDGDSEEDTGTGSDCAHEVGEDGEAADAHATEGGSNRDVAVQHLDGRPVRH